MFSFVQCFWLAIFSTETARLVPEHLVTYKVFGEPEGPHYAHYDLVGGRLVCTILVLFSHLENILFDCVFAVLLL